MKCIYFSNIIDLSIYDLQKCIYSNTQKLVELIVLKLETDWFPILDLLSVAFNPNCKSVV